MRESVVENYLMLQVEHSGGLCWKWTSSRRGVPDRVVVLNGHVVFVEVKAPEGTVTPQQLHVHEELRSRGAVVAVVSSKEECIEFVKGLMQ